MEVVIKNKFFTKRFSWTEGGDDAHWFIQTPLSWGESAIGGFFGETQWLSQEKVSLEAYSSLIQEGVYNALLKAGWKDSDAMYASLFEGYSQLLYAAGHVLGQEESILKALRWAVNNGLEDQVYEVFASGDEYVSVIDKLAELEKGRPKKGDEIALMFDRVAFGGNPERYVA
jgi:hypothetical protein